MDSVILWALLLFKVLESRPTLFGSTLLLTEETSLAIIIQSTGGACRRIVRAFIYLDIGSIDVVSSELLAHLRRLGFSHSTHQGVPYFSFACYSSRIIVLTLHALTARGLEVVHQHSVGVHVG